MNNVFSYYTKYRNHKDEYNQWNKEQSQVPHNSACKSSDELKRKAKAIAEPILLLDNYTHEKAEDSETFYQTLNTEVMSVTGVLCTIPIAFTQSTIDFLNKYADKSELIEKAVTTLSKFKNKSFNIAGKKLSLPNIATIFTTTGAMIFFVKSIKKSLEGQLGLTRKASFDGTKHIINDPKMFAILTPEQEEQLQSIINYNDEHKTAFVDKLKDKIDISSSFRSVNEYKRTNSAFKKEKAEYFEQINKDSKKKLSSAQIQKANEDKQLFQTLLKNVEHDVLKPLQKVETMANIGYSALFAGGFLEYLITDKVVDVLKVKNKPLQFILKLGVPILTYLLLNKNISNFENKAILATKYKHLKMFMDNPEQYNAPKEEEQNIVDFIKTVAKDMKDYDQFTQTELPKIKDKLEAKKQLQLTNEQMKEAKRLQKNTAMVVNTQKEHFFDKTIGIETLSEIISNPIDILGTAVGAKIGNMLAQKCNPKYKGLMTALGTIAGFVPIAWMEAYFTKEQKLAEKISTMCAMKDLQNPNKFADYSDNMYSNLLVSESNSSAFKEITNIFS